MINLQKIKSLEGTKIFSMTKSERGSLMESFPAMMKMIGIPGITDAKEAVLVLQTVELLLIDSFADLTAEEIRYAFLQYSAGTIEIGKDDKHYGLWNLKFIGAVLSQFRRIKQELLAQKPQTEYINQSHQLNAKSKFEQWKEDYIYMLNWIKADGKIPTQGNFTTCFRYLKATGRITLTNGVYNDHIATVRGIVNQEADELQTPQHRSSYRKTFSPDTVAFKNKCRELFFRYWMEDQLHDNTVDGKFDHWIDEEIKRAQSVEVTA